jgi:hypothetical protein
LLGRDLKVFLVKAEEIGVIIKSHGEACLPDGMLLAEQVVE